jgi:hypothetical protein
MGTVSFDGQFKGMRKPQDFVVYPMSEVTTCAKIQADSRCGYIDLRTGEILLAKGGYDFGAVQPCDSLNSEELLLLKAAIMGTASAKAGTKSVVCDNSGALDVFQLKGDF